jgi:hypothetical protein
MEEKSVLLGEGQEQYNVFASISEKLVGCREGKIDEILDEVHRLVEMKKEFNAQESVKDLIDKIEELNELVEIIQND